jgi:hypothetical protein
MRIAMRALIRARRYQANPQIFELIRARTKFDLKLGLWQNTALDGVQGDEHGNSHGHFHGNMAPLLDITEMENNPSLKEIVREGRSVPIPSEALLSSSDPRERIGYSADRHWAGQHASGMGGGHRHCPAAFIVQGLQQPLAVDLGGKKRWRNPSADPSGGDHRKSRNPALSLARPGIALHEVAKHFHTHSAEMGAVFDHFAYSPCGLGIAMDTDYRLRPEDVLLSISDANSTPISQTQASRLQWEISPLHSSIVTQRSLHVSP